MRGKVKEFACKDGSPRITPAYAGKSLRPSGNIRDRRDHPRVCGEKFIFASIRFFPQGSPPRMRGKVNRYWEGKIEAGITPAYAGKSTPFLLPRTSCRDHPRVCGEKYLNMMNEQREKGSPPRMRGKGIVSGWCSQCIGITPAYAGKSEAYPPQLGIRRDHPRVCGEKTKKIP